MILDKFRPIIDTLQRYATPHVFRFSLEQDQLKKGFMTAKINVWVTAKLL